LPTLRGYRHNPKSARWINFQRRDNLHALSVGDRLTGGRGGSPLARRCPFVSRLPSKAASTGTTVPKRATEAARSRKASLCIMNERVEMDSYKRKSVREIQPRRDRNGMCERIYSEACKYF